MCNCVLYVSSVLVYICTLYVHCVPESMSVGVDWNGGGGGGAGAGAGAGGH